MKSVMASDYVLPKKGFFSQHQNHSFNHALMNPNSNDHKPQPKRYNPNPYPAETITWTKPDHDPFETSYRAAFKDISSGKITGRTTEREVIVDRNLTASLIPKNFPSYSQKKNVPHHVSGIYGRDFSENHRPAKTQYPNVKYIDNMATTTLAATTARTREASASPLGRHGHGTKTAANVLRAIYTNKSDLAEHIREDHDDPHIAYQNMVNKELFKEDLVKYTKAFSGRAGSSSISKRMDTIAPKKKERRDVSNSEHIKKLMNNTYAAERDYKQVDRDFKYSYVAACHTRHPVADKSYVELDSSRYGRGRSYTGGRIMNEDYYSRSRSRTPELGTSKREEKSSKKSRKETESSTPIKGKKSKSSKDTTPRSTRSATGAMSVNKLIKKYV